MMRRIYSAIFISILLVVSSASTVVVRTKAGNPASMLLDRKQARTVSSLSSVVDGKFYSMSYKADYKLQEFLDSDLDSQEKLKMAIAAKLLDFNALQVSMAPVRPACSAFQAVTPEGDVIYARNFDYIFNHSGSVMLKTVPKRAFKSIGISSMSFVDLDARKLGDGKTDVSFLVGAPYMQMDGMNEKGLAISVLELGHKGPMQFEEGKHSVMTSVLIRAILDRASSVDEAIELAAGYNFFADGDQRGRDYQSNYHFFISDRSGKTALIEYVLEDGPASDSRWVMNVVDTKVATNFYLSEGWENVIQKDDRYGKLVKALDQCDGVMTEEEAMQVLSSVQQIATRSHLSKTQWSVVYNLTKGTAKVCVEGDYSDIHDFSMKKSYL